MITVKIFRFDPDVNETPYYETFQVPHGPGFMVLDALNYIRENHDKTLRYRHSCHMGKCGSCAVCIDGRPGLACWELAYDGMVVEPLTGLEVIADLVVDRIEDNPIAMDLANEKEMRAAAQDNRPGLEPHCVQHRMALDEVRKCINCFSCVSACPYIHADEKIFSGPRQMSQVARLAYDPRSTDAKIADLAVSLGVWDCVACRACTSVCPQEIDARKRIMDLRSLIINKPELKGMPPGVKQMNESLLKAGNPHRARRGARDKWSEGLDLKDLSQGQKADYLFFAGCAQSYDPEDQQIARVLVELFKAGDIDFGTLRKKETCCGDPARYTGEQDLFDWIRETNIALFSKSGINSIITACPHSYNLFKNGYGIDSVKIYHYVHILADLIKADRLPIRSQLKRRVTFHDSCYLGRYAGVYETPRFVLNALPGVDLVEMKNNRQNSLCCGGGGGGAFLEIEASPRLSWIRAQQAADTGADTLAVACPFCRTMLADAARTSGLSLDVKHVCELVYEALET